MSDVGLPPIPSLAAIRAQLELLGGGPKKSFGQHFLSDPALLRRIVDLAQLEVGDTVLEVGPGPGVLTAALLERQVSIVAVEADRQMIEVHRQLIGSPAGLEIVEQDVLCERPAPSTAVRACLARATPGRGYAFVSNLPYAIASPLLIDVFEAFPPRVAVVMVQREVGQRMRATPGSAEYGALSVLIQLRATVEECIRLKPGAFWPPPKVDSVVLRLLPKPQAAADEVSIERLHETVRRSFSERRKKLKNTLLRGSTASGGDLECALVESGFDPEVRAERLAPEAFLRLAKVLSTLEREGARPQTGT